MIHPSSKAWDDSDGVLVLLMHLQLRDVNVNARHPPSFTLLQVSRYFS
jgi:hypothetical protein